MSLRTTPLQFAYFFALLFFLLLFFRGIKQERLADKILGFLLFLLAFEIQDYTFGFAGINILWNELNGFPRGLTLLIGPTLYFYLKAQTNSSFKLQWIHSLHLIPWLIKVGIELPIFLQGQEAVQAFQMSDTAVVLGTLNRVVRYASYIIYFYLSLRIYRAYRSWSVQHVSNAETISFQWFRNVVVGIITSFVVKEGISTFSNIYDLSFYKDWWWNLVMGAVILYIGLKGYTQHQPNHIDFSFGSDDTLDNKIPADKDQTAEDAALAERIVSYVQTHKPYLKPDLSIAQFSKQLGYSMAEVSAYINKTYGKNFNDYINGHRVAEFKVQVNEPENKDYTLLAIALDCGFNSKSTFNRAFKKTEGMSPKEWLGTHQQKKL